MILIYIYIINLNNISPNPKFEPLRIPSYLIIYLYIFIINFQMFTEKELSSLISVLKRSWALLPSVAGRMS